MKVILGVGFGESYQSSQLRQTNYGMAQWPERSLSEKQPRSGEMFIARMHSQFVLFRNERNVGILLISEEQRIKGASHSINILCLRHFPDRLYEACSRSYVASSGSS